MFDDDDFFADRSAVATLRSMVRKLMPASEKQLIEGMADGLERAFDDPHMHTVHVVVNGQYVGRVRLVR